MTGMFVLPTIEHYKGFEISAYVPGGRGVCSVYPKGCYYGTVDGWCCTGPCSTTEHAVKDAIFHLEHQGLVATLLTHISCLGRSIGQGAQADADTDEIQRGRALLRKILEAGLLSPDSMFFDEAHVVAGLTAGGIS